MRTEFVPGEGYVQKPDAYTPPVVAPEPEAEPAPPGTLYRTLIAKGIDPPPGFYSERYFEALKGGGGVVCPESGRFCRHRCESGGECWEDAK